jgi:hypothetical protein
MIMTSLGTIMANQALSHHSVNWLGCRNKPIPAWTKAEEDCSVYAFSVENQFV